MLRYMLDTDICIYAMKQRPDSLAHRFDEVSDQLSISTVTAGELIYGAEKSARVTANLQAIEAFLARLEVLPFDAKAAAHFAQVRAELERAGRPIGAYDLMIGGHARSQGLVLVTNNEREFSRIPGLRVENWTR
jgi:tRNA(fMet)-specific endonuclease VapC